MKIQNKLDLTDVEFKNEAEFNDLLEAHWVMYGVVPKRIYVTYKQRDMILNFVPSFISQYFEGKGRFFMYNESRIILKKAKKNI